MLQRPSTRRSTLPSPEQQTAADRAEDARIGAIVSWRDEWASGFHCALQLAFAIKRRDWDVARDAFYHLQILFDESVRSS